MIGSGSLQFVSWNLSSFDLSSGLYLWVKIMTDTQLLPSIFWGPLIKNIFLGFWAISTSYYRNLLYTSVYPYPTFFTIHFGRECSVEAHCLDRMLCALQRQSLEGSGGSGCRSKFVTPIPWLKTKTSSHMFPLKYHTWSLKVCKISVVCNN